MQTPAGLQQPWLAGGGATVRGLDEANPMRGFAHTYHTPGGKPGTFALMGDGSIRFIPADIDPKVLLAMATRAGGEDIAGVIDQAAPKVDPPRKREVDLKTDPTPAEPKEGAAKKEGEAKAVTPPAEPKKEGEPKAGPTEKAPEPREKK
jgi:hypothetical protein